MINESKFNTKLVVCAAVILAGILLGGVLVWAMKATQAAPLVEVRAQERYANLAEYKKASTEAMQQYGWVDEAKGLVQLPVDRAMELAAKEWQNPAEARAKLKKMMEKATAPAPSLFE